MRNIFNPLTYFLLFFPLYCDIEARSDIYLMTTLALFLEYLSAYNKHDINEIVSFLHPDCIVIYNNQVAMKGVDAMRPSYENDFLNPQASATLLEHHEDPEHDDRIRVLLKTHNNQLVEVTYVFEEKKLDAEGQKVKMIEHIIHSVKDE